ncbi:MAG: dipeptidase [Halioglobus sp.]
MKTLFSCLALVLAIALGLAATLGPGLLEKSMNIVLPQVDTPLSEEAIALHSTLTIGDLHTDSTLWQRNLSQRADRGHVDLPRLREGNVALQMFTSVTKSPAGQNYEKNSTEARDNITLLAVLQRWPVRTWSNLTERALYQAERLQALAADYPAELGIITSQGDLERVMTARRGGSKMVGGLLGTEGSHALEGELANIERLYDAGFRMMGLQHFFDNRLGGSLHGTSGAGLTEFGRAAVAAMDERQIMIDVAHSSEAVVADVLAMTDRPLIVSHTGFNGHCDSPRNISDALMLEIANEGGLIGVGYWDGAICTPTPTGIVEAIRYGIELVGEDHIALGSDYDGTIAAPFDTSGLILLTQQMIEQGMTEAQIRKVMGENMLRFLRENLPPAN